MKTKGFKRGGPAAVALIVSSMAAAAESSSAEALREELKQTLTPLRLAVSEQATAVIHALTARALETLAARLCGDPAQRRVAGSADGPPSDAS